MSDRIREEASTIIDVDEEFGNMPI